MNNKERARLERAKRKLLKQGLFVKRFRRGAESGFMIYNGFNVIQSGDLSPLTLEDVERWANE